MIKGFEVGKYYRYIGPKKLPKDWNKGMASVLDRKPHKCIRVSTPKAFIKEGPCCAFLEGMTEPNPTELAKEINLTWCFWGDYNKFEEVTNLPK